MKGQCWLWWNGWAESSDEDGEPILAGYMHDPKEQEWECAALRGRKVCPVHNHESER